MNSRKILDWDNTKENFGKAFAGAMSTIVWISGIGIRLVRAPKIHVMRQVAAVVIIGCLIQLLRLFRASPDDVILPALGLVTFTIYVAFQNVYYFFLHNKLRLDRFGKDRVETLQVTSIFYTFLAVTSNVIIGCSLISVFSSESPLVLALGTTLAMACTMEALADGHLPYLACGILFLSSLLLLGVAFLLFASIYGVHYAVCRCCHGGRPDAGMLSQLKRETIGRLLATVVAPCSKAQSGMVCTICLETLKSKEEVVELDCNATHTFHAGCIREWVCRANVCPICRASVVPQELYCFD